MDAESLYDVSLVFDLDNLPANKGEVDVFWFKYYTIIHRGMDCESCSVEAKLFCFCI